MREINAVVIIETVPHASGYRKGFARVGTPATNSVKRIFLAARSERVSNVAR